MSFVENTYRYGGFVSLPGRTARAVLLAQIHKHLCRFSDINLLEAWSLREGVAQVGNCATCGASRKARLISAPIYTNEKGVYHDDAST
jgi:hypothetical protein